MVLVGQLVGRERARGNPRAGVGLHRAGEFEMVQLAGVFQRGSHLAVHQHLDALDGEA